MSIMSIYCLMTMNEASEENGPYSEEKVVTSERRGSLRTENGEVMGLDTRRTIAC